ncbi:MAG: hypothetical protein JWR15_522 [Prosthecobacter sp.]|nr:hypothetical protein [Prosthecobacter sp.]
MDRCIKSAASIFAYVFETAIMAEQILICARKKEILIHALFCLSIFQASKRCRKLARTSSHGRAVSGCA